MLELKEEVDAFQCTEKHIEKNKSANTKVEDESVKKSEEFFLENDHKSKASSKNKTNEINETPKRTRRVAPQNGCPDLKAWTVHESKNKVILPNETSENICDKNYLKYNGFAHSACRGLEETAPCLENGVFQNGVDFGTIVVTQNPKKFLNLKLPYFIIIISIIEASVFLFGGDDAERLLVYNPHNRVEVWRFLSYSLLHADVIHIVLNIVIQCLVSLPLEGEQGWSRCSAVYLGGILAGSLGASVLQPDLYMVGASAGVYALLISHLPNVTLNRPLLRYKRYRCFAVFVVCISDMGFVAVHHLQGQNAEPPIGVAAHLCGALGGALLGMVLYNGPERSNKYVVSAVWISAILLSTFVAVTVVCNVFLHIPSFPYPKPP